MKSLTRRTFCLSATATALLSGAAWARDGTDFLDRARTLIARQVTVDLHAHPGKLYKGGNPIPRLRDLAKAQITAFGFSIPTDMPILGQLGGLPRPMRDPEPGELYAFTLERLSALHRALGEAGIAVLKTPADVLAAKAKGSPGALIEMEGGDFLEGQLERVAQAHALGVHSIQLAHYTPNALASVLLTQSGGGPALTNFGRDVVREQNRLGMIVDVTHMVRDGVEAVAETSHAPIMLSHTGYEDHFARGRGVHDDVVQPVKATGGIIGLRPLGGKDGHKDLSAFADEMMRLIEHVGIEHVALGTDMDGAKSPFKGYGAMALFISELYQRGLSDAEITKVIGGNFMRVFAKVIESAEAS